MSIVLSTMFLAPACKEEPDIQPPDKEYDSRLDIKWIKWFTQDSAGAYFLDPMFYGDYVVFCTDMPVGDNGRLGLGVFHKTTGERHYAWNEPFPDLTQGLSSDIPGWTLCGSEGEIAILSAQNHLFGWDLKSGSLLWQHHTAPYYGSTNVTQIFSKPYHTSEPGSSIWSKITRFDAYSGAKEDLVTVP